MKNIKITLLLLGCVLLAACGGEPEKQAEKPIETPTEKPIELGTDIASIIEADVKPEPLKMADTDAQELKWDDLVPEDFKPEKVMAKYQQEITDAAEGSKEERDLYEKIMGELNNAEPNFALNGKKVRIPGFVSPLDTNGDVVGDFLLVPYYGSCIHSPPPPVNQTVMVSPGEGKSISLSKIRRPVWVVGELEVDEITTDLAKAGYQIKNAQIEPYTQPVN
jgi:hypothetical protein